MKFAVACLGSFLMFAVVSACAQSPDGGASSSTKPPDGQAATPANAATDKKKAKKVWTNEDMGSVKGGVSVVGDGHPSIGTGKAKEPSGGDQVHRKQIENYRNQIQQYQSQIQAIDKRIAQLRNFKGENSSPSGGININQGYNMVPVEEQVKQLEDKKKQLEAKIEDTENDARKNGIEPGDLR
jgi:hypothetical protein